MKPIPRLVQILEAVLFKYGAIGSLRIRHTRQQAKSIRDRICTAIANNINTIELLAEHVNLDYFSRRYHLGVLVREGRIVKRGCGVDKRKRYALAEHQNGGIIKRYADELSAPSFLSSTGWIRRRGQAIPLNEQEEEKVLQRQREIHPVFLYEVSPL